MANVVGITLSDRILDLTQSDDRVLNAIRFSHAAELMATGDIVGELWIYETRKWAIIRNYRASSMIRAIAWHPKQTRTLAVGCANGDVIILRLSQGKPEKDTSSIRNYEGQIRLLEYSRSGEELAVAFGDTIMLNNQHSGLERSLPTQDSFPRGLHFVGSDKIIVTYLNGTIIMYSTVAPCDVLRHFILRSRFAIGASALSPTEELLAIINLTDGIDFLTVQDGAYVCTTQFDLKERFLVALQFTTDRAVIAGRSHGGLILAEYGLGTNPERYALEKKSRTNLVAVGRRDGRVIIAAASVGRHGAPLNAHRGNKKAVLQILVEDDKGTLTKEDPEAGPMEETFAPEESKPGLKDPVNVVKQTGTWPWKAWVAGFVIAGFFHYYISIGPDVEDTSQVQAHNDVRTTKTVTATTTWTVTSTITTISPDTAYMSCHETCRIASALSMDVSTAEGTTLGPPVARWAEAEVVQTAEMVFRLSMPTMTVTKTSTTSITATTTAFITQTVPITKTKVVTVVETPKDSPTQIVAVGITEATTVVFSVWQVLLLLLLSIPVWMSLGFGYTVEWVFERFIRPYVGPYILAYIIRWWC